MELFSLIPELLLLSYWACGMSKPKLYFFSIHFWPHPHVCHSLWSFHFYPHFHYNNLLISLASISNKPFLLNIWSLWKRSQHHYYIKVIFTCCSGWTDESRNVYIIGKWEKLKTFGSVQNTNLNKFSYFSLTIDPLKHWM